VATDLERLQLTFRLNDSLQMSAGRYHTGIGYYNTAFHHGSYFETPIGRPRVFDFEDEGGVLPVHEVGISVRGAVPNTGSALRYLAEIGNGRTWIDEEDAEADRNGSKSTNVGLSLRPERWRGVDRHVARIPHISPALVRRHTDRGVVYRTTNTEVMAEWLTLSHTIADTPAVHNHGGYAQASRSWGRMRPYYRFDRLAISPSTPFIGDRGSYQANIIGLRFDPAMWIGLKAQYERTNEAGVHGIDAVRTQLVFVF
jgi:hypothetical protein